MIRRVIALALLPAALLLLCTGYVPAQKAPPAAKGVATNVAEDVAPLLQRCETCHSGAKPEAGLDLSSRTLALKGGRSGAALVPRDAARSLLFRRVSAKQMPPGAPFTQAEIATLQRWIASGAAWPEAHRAGLDWWSLRPLSHPTPPSTKALPPKWAAWAHNPIDAFVMAKLKSKGLTPAPPADPATLIRRVTFDLVGEPPTPQEIARFLADHTPGAYEHLVDRLLADPRYGERWGRHWLDVARFSESDGFERDNTRPNAWRYRDYVIGALNQDKPYARFVTEQIAGDVLAPGTPDGIAATGFLVAGPWDEVGHSQVSSAMRSHVRDEEMEEMVGTVCQTFVGLTVNCARCHDHKFDPIPQRDYYRVRSALDGVQHGDRPLLTADALRTRADRAARMRTEESVTEANIARIENAARARVVPANLQTDRTPHAPAPFARWTFNQDASDSCGRLNGTLEGGARIANGSLVLDGHGAYFRSASLPQPLKEKTLEAWVRLPDTKQGGGAAISVQTIDGVQFDAIVFGEREPGKWIAGSDNFRRTRDLAAPLETAGPAEPIHVAVVYRSDNSIRVYRNGKLYAPAYTPAGSGLHTFPAGISQVLIGLRHQTAGNGFLRGAVDEARLYDRALTDAEVAASYEAGVDNVSRDAIRDALTAGERAQLTALRAQLDQQQAALSALESNPTVYAAAPTQPDPTHLLIRGDSENPGDVVTPGALTCVRSISPDFGLAANAPEGQRRLQLAAWITNPANPLTPRVLVNRVWHYHFGRGIVGTPNDFGYNGERPTHPELLDWLADWFLKEGGHLKPLHRLILLSNAYRQSSRYDAASAEKDSEDRFLWRFAPRRLEGEAIRDAMLCVSGGLNPQMGGPSFRPFTEVVDNAHFYSQFDSPEPAYNRRTVYRISVNSAKNPLLEALDCPDPSTKTPKRETTTTPLQALELMNSSFVQRQAHMFADRLEKLAPNALDARVVMAFQLAFGRAPSAAEATRSAALVRDHGLNSLCWALLNSTEFLYLR